MDLHAVTPHNQKHSQDPLDTDSPPWHTQTSLSADMPSRENLRSLEGRLGYSSLAISLTTVSLTEYVKIL